MDVLKMSFLKLGQYFRKPLFGWRLLMGDTPIPPEQGEMFIRYEEAGETREDTAGDREEMNPGSGEEPLEWIDGNENMYRGILWMKEKYEQHRIQADQRYERLRAELSRSEQRFQDMLLRVEENKVSFPLTVGQPKEILPDELGAKQAVIDELEEQLRVERLKVEELIVKLQTNGQLLQQIYQELDKSYVPQKPPAQME
jgi:hypothetical protein